MRAYGKIANKYKDALPTTGRIERQIAEKRKKVQSNVLSFTLVLFRLAHAGDAKATVNVPGIGGGEAKNKIRKDAKRHQELVAKDSAKTRRRYGNPEQFYIGGFDLHMSADDEEFLKKVENHMMRKGVSISSTAGGEFKCLPSFLKSKTLCFHTGWIAPATATWRRSTL